MLLCIFSTELLFGINIRYDHNQIAFVRLLIVQNTVLSHFRVMAPALQNPGKLLGLSAVPAEFQGGTKEWEERQPAKIPKRSSLTLFANQPLATALHLASG